MAQSDHPVVQQLEEQLEQIRERLQRKEQRGRGWWLTFTGLSLGALAGGALAYYLRSRDEEAPYMPPSPPPAPLRRDDAIVLKPSTTPTPTPAPTVEDAAIELKSAAITTTEPTPASEETPVVEAAAEEQAAPEVEAVPQVEEQPAATIAPLMAATEPRIESAPEVVTEAAAAPTESAAAPAIAAAPEATNEVAEAEADQPAEAQGANEAGPHAGSVLPVDNQCPASHPIKGNLSRNSVLIFHVPGSNNYDRTHPEVCFADEASAEAAGFRKARS